MFPFPSALPRRTRIPRASFAGEYETVLDVRADEDIRSAIRAVRLSRHGAGAAAYGRAQGLEREEQEMAVVVQLFVRADVSGVLFTVDPATGSAAQMTGNFVHGVGDVLVSGRVIRAPSHSIAPGAGMTARGN